LQALKLPDIITINQFILLGYHRLTGLTTTLLRRRSMKLVKNFVFAMLFASILAVSVPAGELGTPGYTEATPSPTPYAMTTYSEETVDDSYALSSGSDTTETSDYLFLEVLAALLSVY
jgi:hypothetical protein